MCGVFGLLPPLLPDSARSHSRAITETLIRLSTSRGSEATGLGLVDDRTIRTFKSPQPGKAFLETDVFDQLASEIPSSQFVFGHLRMETHGSSEDERNLHPVNRDGISTVHNGIIVNYREMAMDLKTSESLALDTSVINLSLRTDLKAGETPDVAAQNLMDRCTGALSFCSVFEEGSHALIGTNTGTLHVLEHRRSVVAFASEKIFLDQILEDLSLPSNEWSIRKLPPGHFEFLKISEIEQPARKTEETFFAPKRRRPVPPPTPWAEAARIVQEDYRHTHEALATVQRCTRCVLPATMPYIEFDSAGVCNWCSSHVLRTMLPIQDLEDRFAKAKAQGKNREYDCIVAFSGGRDSSYSLYQIKERYGLRPLAFSYDWGMLTDLGRRNQARMTGYFGVEHLLVSADIHAKRRNVRKNVEAWLKRPRLGTVPLFMAGDKQYFYYAQKLAKDYDVPLVIMGENHYEKTGFKNGFASVRQERGGFMAYHVSPAQKARMLMYYGKQFLANPAYLNSSLLDSTTAFLSYFVLSHDYLNLFDYLPWDETEVDEVLRRTDWEFSPESSTSWRMGDGTAPFYNYIYFATAGLSEHDTFLSNLIRDGKLDRQTAVTRLEAANQPQLQGLKWYFETIGVDFKNAVQAVHEMPKLYPFPNA